MLRKKLVIESNDNDAQLHLGETVELIINARSIDLTCHTRKDQVAYLRELGQMLMAGAAELGADVQEQAA